MAYVGDIFTSRKEKQKELGILIACYVLGVSGGGIIAVLMGKYGLFMPLLAGGAFMFLSTIMTYFLMVNPDDARLYRAETKIHPDEKVMVRPETVNKRILWNVVLGSVADNFGSTALWPLCLSPLALEHYTLDFIHAGKEPIMSIVGFQLISVCIAFTVVPSTKISPRLFEKVGIAGACVLGNVFTAIVTLILLVIGNM
eukprot:10103761-Ditylum_brightwellii.AAC.1